MNRLPDASIARLREVAAWPGLSPDRYEIRRLLGRGGMGTVYAAYDSRLGREVALKVSNAPGATSHLEARLRREARVLAHLEHPGIVPVHDTGELDDGRWFYVMKLVHGQTLAEHVAGLRGLTPRLAVFERITETVAFAHSAGIIHRDLKPSNIMVGSFGEVLVLDWGVAKILGEMGAHATAGPEEPTHVAAASTAAGVRIGTPGFMAPELYRGDAATAGPSSDVYSLGALLFWMLASTTVPATGDEATRALAVLPEPPPRRLRAIVAKCLSESPADRYEDAAAVVEELARFRAGLSVSAHPETVLERAGRVFDRYRSFILLVLAYLIMRALFAWAQRW